MASQREPLALRQERCIDIEHQPFVEGTVWFLQEVVSGKKIARNSSFRTVVINVKQEDVNLVSRIRWDQIRERMWSPWASEYGGNPVIDVVTSARAEKPVRYHVDHRLANIPPLIIGYPYDQRDGTIGDHLSGSSPNIGRVAYLESEPVAYGDRGLRLLQQQLPMGFGAQQRWRVGIELGDPGLAPNGVLASDGGAGQVRFRVLQVLCTRCRQQSFCTHDTTRPSARTRGGVSDNDIDFRSRLTELDSVLGRLCRVGNGTDLITTSAVDAGGFFLRCGLLWRCGPIRWLRLPAVRREIDMQRVPADGPGTVALHLDVVSSWFHRCRHPEIVAQPAVVIGTKSTERVVEHTERVGGPGSGCAQGAGLAYLDREEIDVTRRQDSRCRRLSRYFGRPWPPTTVIVIQRRVTLPKPDQ